MSEEKSLWEADATHPQESHQVREALREVVDPELGLSVVALGLIRDLHIQDGTQHLKMIMTTPFCPYGPALLEATRSKAEQASGRDTTIEVGMDPWDPSMMEEGVGAEWGLF
ncbi:MAG TPA: metal-sulfur cluster assembly factor [Anaerolineales bacterium]|jgi:metal-sulfur cluster biosynthetic enzyme|nr:metal-sulfur cluster assembly factor [Anaerolineales bacterium]